MSHLRRDDGSTFDLGQPRDKRGRFAKQKKQSREPGASVQPDEPEDWLMRLEGDAIRASERLEQILKESKL